MWDTLKERLAQSRGHMTATNGEMLKRQRGEGRVSAFSSLLHLIFTKNLKRKAKICITLKRGLK